jgi:multiple sugar transport system permease protein
MTIETFQAESETPANRLRSRFSQFINDHIRIFLLGPALLALLAVFIYPVIILIWTSLLRVQGAVTEFAPLYNYTRIFSDPAFWNAVQNTLIYSFGSLFLSMVAGFLFALALNKIINQRVRAVYTTLILLSWAVPLSVVGVTWRWMFNGQLGVVNRILIDVGLLGSPYGFLANSTSAMILVILADSWSRIPFVTIIILAGLQSIPEEMYDAAKADGATTFQTFRHVTLPYLRPSFFVAALITWMFAWRAFAIPFTTTGGGPGNATTMLSIYIQQYGINLFNYGLASAVAVFLVAVTLVVAAIYVNVILERMQEVEV